MWWDYLFPSIISVLGVVIGIFAGSHISYTAQNRKPPISAPKIVKDFLNKEPEPKAKKKIEDKRFH